MKNKLFILFFILALSFVTNAQNVKSVKIEKERIEKEILYLNKLLKEAAKDRDLSINKLKIIQENIYQSENLLSTLETELFLIEKDISTNEKKILKLNSEKNNILKLYSDLIYESWKKRDETNKLMFILAAENFNQAYKRFKYLQQIEDYSSRHIDKLEKINDSLKVQNNILNSLQNEKLLLKSSVDKENLSLIKLKVQENGVVTNLQKKESQLKRKLNDEVAKRKKLDTQLNKLIKQEIKKTTGDSKSNKFSLTPEEKLVSSNFENNKGKLPWPLLEGFISKKFGLNSDPIYKNIVNFNNGIDITTSKNAAVRAVFKGEVIKVWHEPYWNYSIFIKHGNYVTVYSNLGNVKVFEGDTVETKEELGNIVNKVGEGNILFFQLWKDSEKQNPALWLAK